MRVTSRDGLGFRVWGLGFEARGIRFGVWGLGGHHLEHADDCTL
jgi:hypothetical protein